MADSSQYVICIPAGTVLASGAADSAKSEIIDHLKSSGVSVHETTSKGLVRLAELNDAQRDDLRRRFPKVVVEPNIRYKLTRSPFLEGFQEINLATAATHRTLAITVVDEKTKAPIPEVTVVLVVSRREKKGYKGRTGEDGVATLHVAGPTSHFELVGLLPKAGHWSRKLADVSIEGESMEFFMRPLPSPDVESYTWAVEETKMQDGAANGGAGVKIAVIDTGIRKDHPDLRPAGGVNCVLHEDEANWFDDQIGHGTHCAGIIGALLDHKGLKSYVPDASIYAYRVFPSDEDAGASTFDIVKALTRAIADGCDLISMSLGSGTEQSSIRLQMEEAHSHGIVCVVASGNDGGPVSYPAAFPIAVAVGAYGKYGTYPDDSLHKDTESDHVSEDKQHFVANFSNFGEELDVIAPGVAIVSTVPGGYAAWDGTSMACPHVSGMAALALASHPDLLNAPRDAARAERLVKLLTSATRTLGVGKTYEGTGCPQVDLILAAK